MDQTELLLKELTETNGISGCEKDVAKTIEKHMRPFAKISYDRLGSIICRKDGATRTPKIMLAAHMDEVGFLVKQITKEGFIKFLPIGGWFSQVNASSSAICSGCSRHGGCQSARERRLDCARSARVSRNLGPHPQAQRGSAPARGG